MKYLFFITYILSSILLFGQVEQRIKQDPTSPYANMDDNDTVSLQRDRRPPVNDSLKIHEPVFSDYKFWKENTKPEMFDTVLSIENFYAQNYLQRDFFGNMLFPNVGQTLNPLTYEVQPHRLQLLPFGKSWNYIYRGDVRYFDVKTPTTELVYENVVRQGQYLSTLFTHNINRQFNYALQYRGLRSMGRFTNELAANNSFVVSTNYHTKNDKLNIWAHFANQNIDNEENGGIQSLDDFVNAEENNMTNPLNIPINLPSSLTKFDSRRFHLGGSYALLSNKNQSDSTTIDKPLVIKNVFTYEKQKMEYRENDAEQILFTSDVLTGYERNNLKSFETLRNQSTLGFNWSDKLNVEAGVLYENIKLYGRDELSVGLIHIPHKIEDNLFGFIGNLSFDWNDKIKLFADAEYSTGDTFTSNYHVNAKLMFEPIEGYAIEGGILTQSQSPGLNLWYNQSFYQDFNYFNRSFENVDTQKVFGKIKLDAFQTSVESNLTNISQYVYVGPDYRPRQLDGNIGIFDIKLENMISYRNFHLRTTALYQKVLQNEQYMPLPDYVLRGSLFWQDYMFKRAANVQAGINVTYFNKFNSRIYFPVIGEFILPYGHPQEQEIGNYPFIDLFINMKVDRMRIYIRAEHINSLFENRSYYSAPYVPYREFKIQLGVKWYLFT